MLENERWIWLKVSWLSCCRLDCFIGRFREKKNWIKKIEKKKLKKKKLKKKKIEKKKKLDLYRNRTRGSSWVSSISENWNWPKYRGESSVLFLSCPEQPPASISSPSLHYMVPEPRPELTVKAGHMFDSWEKAITSLSGGVDIRVHTSVRVTLAKQLVGKCCCITFCLCL